MGRWGGGLKEARGQGVSPVHRRDAKYPGTPICGTIEIVLGEPSWENRDAGFVLTWGTSTQARPASRAS
jgi:hypothetical protein